MTSVRNKSTWTVLGQQVMFAPQTPTGAVAGNADSWDGYRGARGRVFDMIERAKVSNPRRADRRRSQLMGVRCAARSFQGYDKATGKGSLGVEFAGTSVTSPSNVGRDGQNNSTI